MNIRDFARHSDSFIVIIPYIRGDCNTCFIEKRYKILIKMIAKEIENQILAFLRIHRTSQRAVAERFGVSRSVVKRIMCHLAGNPVQQSNTPSKDIIVLPNGVPRRCPGCGHRVQMPCLACQLRGRE